VMVGPIVTAMAVTAANQLSECEKPRSVSCLRLPNGRFRFARRRRHPSQFHLRDAARRCLTA
jgi:hypothetical protein